MSTNIARRLGVVVSDALAVGQPQLASASTAQVWASALGAGGNDEAFFASIGSLRRDLRRLRIQLGYANAGLLASREAELLQLEQALSPASLSQPWNNTRRLLSQPVRIALEAFDAALDGRFVEPTLNEEQVHYAASLLERWLDSLDAEAIEPHIKMFLAEAVERLRGALLRMRSLGVDDFAEKADHLLAVITQTAAASTAGQSPSKRALKGLGIAVASISAAVTMSIGVLDLDDKTFDVLPWGDKADKTVVQCVLDGRDVEPPSAIDPSSSLTSVVSPLASPPASDEMEK